MSGKKTMLGGTFMLIVSLFFFLTTHTHYLFSYIIPLFTILQWTLLSPCPSLNSVVELEVVSNSQCGPVFEEFNGVKLMPIDSQSQFDGNIVVEVDKGVDDNEQVSLGPKSIPIHYESNVNVLVEEVDTQEEKNGC
ncbi:hypothetical protein CsatA_011089 [Cannabis sativa]